MEQSPTGTAAGNAAASPRGTCGECAFCGFVELVATPRVATLPTREGPVRRGEPITRQPGRGLVIAVTLSGVHRRPKARTHCSIALPRLVQPPKQATERLRPSPNRPILRQPSPPPVSCAGGPKPAASAL